MNAGDQIQKRMSKEVNRQGYTLVELMIVLVILSIMAAITVPPLTGFIEQAEKERYVLEAQGVRRGIEYYLLDHYGEELDTMALLFDFTSTRLDSPKNPLAGYLTVGITKGAKLEGMTVDTSACRVAGIIYRVAGYRIEIIEDDISVDRAD